MTPELSIILDGIRRAGSCVRTGDYTVTGYQPDELARLLHLRRHGELVLLNYSDVATYHASWNSFLRVCRGIVFDSHGDLVSFPLQKFFNLNECDGWLDVQVSTWDLLAVTEKVDGVMIQVFPYRNSIVWASRHGIETRAARIARELAGDSIRQLVSHLPYPRWTLVMELVHPDVWQPGMVHPGEERALYPLYIRWLHNMELVPASAMWERVPAPFRLPKQYLVSDLESALKLVRSAQTPDWEGVVLQGAGELCNQLVKLKSPLYLQRLSVVKGLSVRRLLQSYRDGGWESLHAMFAGVEELRERHPFRAVIERLIELEREAREHAQSYLGLPVESIPPAWRWVFGYRDKPEQFERALRRAVFHTIEQEYRLDDKE